MSVRHALLALLSEGPKYGLQLRQEFEARTGEVWPLNVGQVYTTLQRLERDGLVTAVGDAEPGGEHGPQKAYRITEHPLQAAPARFDPNKAQFPGPLPNATPLVETVEVRCNDPNIQAVVPGSLTSPVPRQKPR